MALVHRSDDYIGPARRASDNLSEVLRGERCRNDAILRHKHNVNTDFKHVEPCEEAPTGNSIEHVSVNESA